MALCNTWRQWLIFLAVGITLFMGNMEMTAANVALPAIANELRLSITELQWVMNAYFLTTAAFLITVGKFSENWGRRRTFLLGLSIFIFISLLGGFSQHGWEVISSRFFQGLGGTACFSMAIVIIYTAFPKTQRGLAAGLVTSVIGLGVAMGPAIGGILIHFFSWRWIFFINVPLGLLSLLLTFAFVPKDEKVTDKITVDYWGITTLILGLAGLIFAINQFSETQFQITFSLIVLLVSLCLLFIFYFIEKHQSQPLIALAMLHNKLFIISCLIRLLIIYVFYGVLFVFSLYMQNILGYSPVKAGLIFLPLTLLGGMLSLFSGIMIDKIGVYRCMLFSAVILLPVYLLAAMLTQNSVAINLIMLLILAGIAYGVSSPATLRAALGSVSEDKVNVATGIYYTFQISSGMLSIALTSFILNLLNINALIKLSAQHQISLDYEQAKIIMQNLVSSYSGYSAIKQPVMIDLARQAFMPGFSATMWLGFLLALLAVALVFIFHRLNKKITT